MKIIVCARDLDFGVGSQVKNELNAYEKNPKITKVIVIGNKELGGYNDKIEFKIIKNLGSFFVTKEPNYAFRCRLIIEKIIRSDDYDRIELHNPILARDFGIKMYVKFHGLHKCILKNHPKTLELILAAIFHKIYSFFDEITMRFSNKIFFVSRRTMKEARNYYPKYSNKFKYSPNYINNKIFYRVNKVVKKHIKKKYGLYDNKKNVLYIGRLEPMKGVMDLIESIKNIGNINYRLIVIGSGPLERKVKSFEFVRYLGVIANSKLNDFYNIADLFVLPSYYENCPMTILEAKACGCKILASNVGDNSIFLKKQNLFEKGNKLELKNKIDDLLNE